VTAVLPAEALPDCAISVAEAPGADWDSFVTGAADASLYHLSGWTTLAREAFGHRTLFVEAREPSGKLRGILPLVQQRSWILGNFATSVAFFNYGGVVATDPRVALQMMSRAAAAAEGLGCRYLEFRDTRPREGNWVLRTDKVALQLELPHTFEALSKRLGSKLRSQVKRAERETLGLRVGSLDLLDAFYRVFAQNMRDLGTPVYPKRFFEAILQKFGEHCQLLVIDWRGEPAAAGFLVFWRGCAEVPWASCRADAKSLGLNMKLYWELLSLSIQRGCNRFDFGRSTVDSGTYRFKRQWGAEPVPLYWYRWERNPSAVDSPQVEQESRALRVATSLWQRLPVWAANALGPFISGALPW